MRKIVMILILIISTFSFSKDENIVLTSTQATYSLSKIVTKGTNIKIESVFDANMSMDYDQNKLFESSEYDHKYSEKAVAIIDMAKVWEQDSFYEHIRRKNIRVIEIDSSYSFSDNTSLSLNLLEYKHGEKKGEINPYVFLDFNNIIKMCHIIKDDLNRIFPGNEEKMNENLMNFKKELFELEQNFSEKSIEYNKDFGVIVFTENLDYLLNSLNIFKIYININDIKAEDISKIIKETNLKVFVSDRNIKKELINEIKKQGSKFVVLNTMSIPIEDDDENMDEDGFRKAMYENIKKLEESLFN